MRNEIVEVDHLSVNYGAVSALTDISLKIYEKEYLGIIGPNGGGKSTLLKVLTGLLEPDKGAVTINGKPVNQSRGKIGYVPQFAVFDRRFPITVGEAVRSARITKHQLFFHHYDDKDEQKARELIDLVGLGALRERQVADLSGGEFQKMLIARALAIDPELLFLDEPTANVDTTSRKQIYDLLDQLNAQMTIVLVTHDLLAVSSRVERLACLNRTLYYHGEPELTENVVDNLYGCPVDLIAHGVPHRVLGPHREEH